MLLLLLLLLGKNFETLVGKTSTNDLKFPTNCPTEFNQAFKQLLFLLPLVPDEKCPDEWVSLALP